MFRISSFWTLHQASEGAWEVQNQGTLPSAPFGIHILEGPSGLVLFVVDSRDSDSRLRASLRAGCFVKGPQETLFQPQAFQQNHFFRFRVESSYSIPRWLWKLRPLRRAAIAISKALIGTDFEPFCAWSCDIKVLLVARDRQTTKLRLARVPVPRCLCHVARPATCDQVFAAAMEHPPVVGAAGTTWPGQS